MDNFWIMCAASVVGTIGFGMIYQMKPKRLPVVAVGGFIACAVFLISRQLGAGMFAANLIASFISGLYSVICARVIKAPVIVFLTPSLIPLVPGGYLFLAIRSLTASDYKAFYDNVVSTAVVAFGISAGIICSSVVGKLILYKKNKKSGAR